MAYSDKDELADYLGKDEADLPDDADRLLDRATELVDYYTLDRINTDVTAQENAAKRATNAQVEWWLEMDDELGILSRINSLSLGSFSVSGGSGSGGNQLTELAPRARQTLFLAGLMNRGVDTKRGYSYNIFNESRI
ncbi:MAG: hypothetical protein ACLFN4_06650 [Candidatus Acetothermia bacterium]